MNKLHALTIDEHACKLMETAELYRNDAKVAVKAGYAIVAERLMAKAVRLANKAHELWQEIK